MPKILFKLKLHVYLKNIYTNHFCKKRYYETAVVKILDNCNPMAIIYKVGFLPSLDVVISYLNEIWLGKLWF